MPRIRRQPDLADVIAYVVGRRKKLKGPTREIYGFLLAVCLDQGARAHPEKLCEECTTKLKDHPRQYLGHHPLELN